MRSILALLAFAVLAASLAAPQLPTPATPPPPLPTSSQATSSSTQQAPPPPPDATSTGPAPPASTPGEPAGSVCECGYTYCGSVLMGMKRPWNEKQLAEAYCKTPDAACTSGEPATKVKSALYLCLCDTPEQRLGNKLHLLCGCDKCLVVEPDFRGRCASPCHSGSCQ